MAIMIGMLVLLCFIILAITTVRISETREHVTQRYGEFITLKFSEFEKNYHLNPKRYIPSCKYEYIVYTHPKTEAMIPICFSGISYWKFIYWRSRLIKPKCKNNSIQETAMIRYLEGVKIDAESQNLPKSTRQIEY